MKTPWFFEELEASLASNILYMTIMPTEQCCFRCTYCYEDFAIGKMSPTVQQGIINLVTKRITGLDLISISWFGGEPLMAKDIIYQLSDSIMALAKQYNTTYSASMTTNAYLLDQACFEKLVHYGVQNFQITLDGPEAIHDNTRQRVDGKGTFAEIMHNLRAIKASTAQATILLRIHYRPDTWQAVLGLIDQLKTELLTDKRFQIMFRPVGKWGGRNDQQLTVFTETQSQETVERYLQEYLATDTTTLGEEQPHVCYAAKANHLVIRADGRLAKCTVALNHPHNAVGCINADGSLAINQDYYKKWLIGFQTGDLDQLACPASTVLAKQSSTPLNAIPVVSIAA